MTPYLPYVLCMVLLAIGIYGMVAKKNVIKIIIGLAITEYAINMFLLLLGWRAGDNPVAPILARGRGISWPTRWTRCHRRWCSPASLSD